MFFRFLLPSLLWASFIFLVSLIPGRGLPTIQFWKVIPFDKLVHATLYAIQVFLLIISFKKQQVYHKLNWHAWQYAIVLSFSYGLILEVLQQFVFIGRNFDFYDVIANTLGCFLGLLAFKLVYYKL